MNNIPMEMDSPTGKKILALVRRADYAHAGEEEAINLVFNNVPRDANRSLLDVGCGRGGTAHYVRQKGWGRVLGIDIDADSINYAKNTYPDVGFVAADVMSLPDEISGRFDLIYLFNSFYTFPDQRRALEQFRLVSRQGGELVIFDYLDKGGAREKFPEWNPLDFSKVEKLFSSAGWNIVAKDNISCLYGKWYQNLVARIDKSSAEIITLAGKEWFDFVRSFYGRIVDAIEGNILGGAIIRAQSRSP
jgi:SAM-dependent methyltransferase